MSFVTGSKWKFPPLKHRDGLLRVRGKAREDEEKEKEEAHLRNHGRKRLILRSPASRLALSPGRVQ